MNTYEWLIKLNNVISQNPAVMSGIDCDEIRKMVYLDIQCRRQLYPKKQLEDVEAFFDGFLIRLKDGFDRHNPMTVQRALEDLISYMRVLPDLDQSTDFIEQANLDRLMLEHIRMKTTYAVGDSHVNFFSGNEELSFIPVGNDINTCRKAGELPFSVFHMGPCLAYNSLTFNTSTKFREKLDYLLCDIIEDEADIMFVMGEIDIRAHVFKESNKRGCDYRTIVDDIVKNYINMMRMVKERGYKVFCFGPIASQSDTVPSGGVFLRYGSEIERNHATEYFNYILKEMCTKEEIKFASIFDQMITSDYKTKTELLCSDGCHLSQKALDIVVNVLMENNFFSFPLK